MSGYSSEPEGAHGGTLNRQQIIAMVKQRFGLNSTGNPARPNATIQEEVYIALKDCCHISLYSWPRYNSIIKLEQRQ